MKVLKDLAISESGFIFNPVNGESFTVNEIGFIILNELKSGKTYDEIIAKIIDEYETTNLEIEKDFTDFVNIMKFHNLVTE